MKIILVSLGLSAAVWSPEYAVRPYPMLQMQKIVADACLYDVQGQN